MKKALSAVASAVTMLSAGAALAAPTGPALVALGPNDADPYVRELPGENLGDGGEFSVGTKRYVRVEGRHVTFRTAAGVKRCVVSQAQATAWTSGNGGTIGCGATRLQKALNPRVRSDMGQPVIVTITEGGKTAKLAGLWQGLD